MRKPYGTGRASGRENLFVWTIFFLAAANVFLAGCSAGPAGRGEFVYVAIPEASLWDRVATIHNQTGLVHNGERLQVLERMQSRRFVRVRSPRGEVGWVQERYLAEQQTFEEFQRLADRFKATAAQASATIERQVKVHLLPGRKAPYLYLLNEKQKVELLQRQPVDRNASPAKEEKPKESDVDASDEEDKSGQPVILEDWWLVRDSQQRVGWVLGRALYLDVPDEIAQYAEGQRIVAVYPLDEVQDHDKKVAEYLALLTEPKDGLPYDFSQFRVYTWNPRKHRYETAYHEHGLFGALPVSLGRQDFQKEGSLRTFTLQLKDKDGQVQAHLYKFNPPIVRKVFAPGEEPKLKPRKSNRKSHRKRHGRLASGDPLPPSNRYGREGKEIGSGTGL